jgi:hypothetical protein
MRRTIFTECLAKYNIAFLTSVINPSIAAKVVTSSTFNSKGNCSRCHRMTVSATISSCKYWRISPVATRVQKCSTSRSPRAKSSFGYIENRKEEHIQPIGDKKYECGKCQTDSGWSECDDTDFDWSESEEK